MSTKSNKVKLFLTTNEEDLNDFADRRRGYHTRPDLFTCYTNEDDANKLATIEKIGLEIETESKSDYADYNTIAKNLSAAFNYKYNALFNYYNEDSSLNNYGLEIITQPFTQSFYNATKADFDELLNIAKNNDLIGHDSGRCGIHAHINRACLGDTSDEIDANIDKIIYFFEYYKTELKKFSRRKSWRYAQFASDAQGYTKTAKALYKLKSLKSASYGHGAAINNGNTNTVEIRIFNSTLRPETFHAIVEFIFNLIKLVKTNKIEDCNLYNLINIQPTEYLLQYFKDRNIKIDKKKVKRLDLEYIKNLNKSFDALQKTELQILKAMLPYYKNIATAQAKAAAEDLKKIKTINLKKIEKTSGAIELHAATNILQTIQKLYTSTNKDREYYSNDFFNYLDSIISYIKTHKKELAIDIEDFTNKIDLDEYTSVINKYREVL